ncbi:MAG: copper resistance protein CopC [Acidisphaera sp.]|nr:copper resistance protein CopC [Acidisphaera sp.]
MRTSRLLVACLLLGMPGAASAHAFLRAASPPVGSTVKAPSEVSIDFTEALEPGFSSIEVRDAQGNRVDKADLHAAPDDAKHVSVSLRPLSPGGYTVTWRALSVDTHRTQGSYGFTVEP